MGYFICFCKGTFFYLNRAEFLLENLEINSTRHLSVHQRSILQCKRSCFCSPQSGGSVTLSGHFWVTDHLLKRRIFE